MKTKIIVFGQSGTFIPAVCDEVVFSTTVNGCGSLEFSVIKEGNLDFKEGNVVIALFNDKEIFRGYVFEKSRNKQGIINVICYDQLRYFKNKDCYTYYNKRASDVLGMIATDYGLKTGEIENTGYYIPYRIEDNSTLFDIMFNALKLTRRYTGKDYILYDDCGKICLKNSLNMMGDYYVNKDNCIDFKYTSSIDRDTYNSIKLVHSDKRSGIYNVFKRENISSIKRFGKLQYYSHISAEVDGNYTANELLEQHNRVGRLLRVTAMGDINIRAGNILRVNLDLGDFTVNCFMKCGSVSHSLSDCKHIMTLVLKGGEFVYE